MVELVVRLDDSKMCRPDEEGIGMAGGPLTRDQLIEIAHRHAAAEARGDMDATMATLGDDPVYELLPVGLTFRGRDAARTYYEYFFSTFRPMAERGELRSEYVSDDGLAQEYVLHVRLPDGTQERHPLVSVLTFGESALAGERVYASERLLRLLFGPAFDLGRPA
jgi:ketosteroid isomerase-like protein